MKLWLYVVRRLLILIPTIIGLTFILFVLSHAGGTQAFLKQYVDPHLTGAARDALIAQLTAKFHLNDPIYIQYFYWLAQVFQGDLGISTSVHISVSTALVWYMPNTLMLTLVASVLTWYISVPIGLYSAVRRDSVADQGARLATFTLYSMPIFLIGFAIFLTVGTGWHLLPMLHTTGSIDPELTVNIPSTWFDHADSVSSPTHILVIDALLNGDLPVAWNAFLHVLMPAATLVLALLAGIVRILRASTLETLEQDYVRLARAKGVPDRIVNSLHAKKNALLPAVTSYGYLVSGLLGGAVVVEDIFGFHGIGWWTTRALINQDVGGIMGSTLIFGLILLFTTLVLDILYAVIDPRIRYE